MPSISDSWESWIEEASVSLRPRTVVAYRHAFKHRIVPKLGTVKVSQLDRRHIVQFVRSLQQDGRAPWTIRGTIAPLGLYLAWANDQGWRTGNPVRELRRGERPKVTRKGRGCPARRGISAAVR